MEAFCSGDYQINFEKLEGAMIQSITGGIYFYELSKLVANEQYPHKAADLIGEH